MKTKQIIAIVTVCLVGAALAHPGECSGTEWFNQEKIRFFWGAWERFDRLGSPETDQGDLYPVSNEELMQNLSKIGATVFVSRQGWSFQETIPGYSEDYYGGTHTGLLQRAALAQQYGLRYLGQVYPDTAIAAAQSIGGRLAVDKYGFTAQEEKDRGMAIDPEYTYVPCPLDDRVVDEWLLVPALDMAGSGVVDGLHIDWEEVGAKNYEKPYYDAECLCYCDDCFGEYMSSKGLTDCVFRPDRYTWLKSRGMLTEYLTRLRDRISGVYRSVAQRVRLVKPNFVFSAYPGFSPGELENSWQVEGTAMGLSSVDVPFFVVDASHYWPNHAAPWWETSYVAHRELGFRHILGSYTLTLLGGQPEFDVSATQWMYDTAISHDGCWVWFEHKWAPDDYRAYRTVDARISTTESKVGDFLLDGVQDNTFVCIVEQSGDPNLGRNVIQRSYHLNNSYLVRINNVNTDTPVEVLVRFPRLQPGTSWTVGDPIGGLYYTRGANNTIWGEVDLRGGVLVPVEKRSEAWLLLTPTSTPPSVTNAQMVSGDVIRAHPERPNTNSVVIAGSTISATFPLVYLKSGPRGYSGGLGQGQVLVMGTSVHYIDATGTGMNEKHLFGIKGSCWSPQLSPDRKKVVFSSYVNGKGQIYLIDSNGSNAYTGDYWLDTRGHNLPFDFMNNGKNISNNAYCDDSPVWSPNGTRIAFVSDRDGDREIYVMNSNGSGQQRLTTSPGVDRSPAWSPDGQTIAFESDRGGDFDIWLVNASGGGERQLVHRSGNEYEPIWSPNGTQIACTMSMYGYNRDILVVNAVDGSSANPRGLTHTAMEWWQYTNISSIRWSPDGARIAGVFEKDSPNGSGIFSIGADGTDLRELVAGQTTKLYPGGYAPVGKRKMMGGWYTNGSASRRWLPKIFKDVSWSPDGSALAFSADIDNSGYFFIYTVPAAGGSVQRLDATLNPIGPNNTIN